jgi:hypothetical protein
MPWPVKSTLMVSRDRVSVTGSTTDSQLGPCRSMLRCSSSTRVRPGVCDCQGRHDSAEGCRRGVGTDRVDEIGADVARSVSP